MLGFEARSESICDVVGMDKGETKETERGMSTVVCGFKQSLDRGVILRYPERERHRRFEKWCRERKSEVSAPLVGGEVLGAERVDKHAVQNDGFNTAPQGSM
jgi:hypothetical protein